MLPYQTQSAVDFCIVCLSYPRWDKSICSIRNTLYLYWQSVQSPILFSYVISSMITVYSFADLLRLPFSSSMIVAYSLRDPDLTILGMIMVRGLQTLI